MMTPRTNGVNLHGSARLSCQHTVRMLMARHQWALVAEHELVTRVLNALPTPTTPEQLERLVMQHYTLILYDACRQTSDHARRDRGYCEVGHYLARVAKQRAPNLADDLVQQALLLVCEQLERCREPIAFLAFARHKLRAAYTQLVSRARPALPLDSIEAQQSEFAQVTHDGEIIAQEAWQLLWAAITQLPCPRQQQALMGKYIEGLSDEAIAARLDLTVNHVRVMRHRALAQLRRNTLLSGYFA